LISYNCYKRRKYDEIKEYYNNNKEDGIDLDHHHDCKKEEYVEGWKREVKQENPKINRWKQALTRDGFNNNNGTNGTNGATELSSIGITCGVVGNTSGTITLSPEQ